MRCTCGKYMLPGSTYWADMGAEMWLMRRWTCRCGRVADSPAFEEVQTVPAQRQKRLALTSMEARPRGSSDSKQAEGEEGQP